MLKERFTTINIWAIIGLLYARDAALWCLKECQRLNTFIAGTACTGNKSVYSWQEWRKGLDRIREQALGPIPQPAQEPAPNPKLDAAARQAAVYLTMLYTLSSGQVYKLKLLARRVEAGLVSEWI